MLLSSEAKARKSFLTIYLMLVFLLIGVISYFYYRSQEQLMFSSQRIEMMDHASEQVRRLKQLHRHYPQESRYPRDSRFESAIYDLEHQKIFSTLKSSYIDLDKVIYSSGEMMHLVRILDDYYMGAKYLIIETPKDKRWYSSIIWKITIYALLALISMIFFGFYLSGLFVRPMKNSIMLLDRFIKDTTHELNTPLSAILANIEMMERDSMSSINIKRLNRIDIGARTVSILYEDLKFLTLEQDIPIDDKPIELKDLIENRLEYFAVLLQSKGLTIKTEMSYVEVVADKRLISRVIDNLLSNAIKYNRRGGKVSILLSGNKLIISDTGIGIPRDKLSTIFDRYTRFNDSEGGFGIGLNIVQKITDHYNIDIDINSEVNVGTEVILKWK